MIDSKTIRWIRIRIIAYTILAAFIANIIGTVFATNIGLFLLFDDKFMGLDNYLNIPPFIFAIASSIIYFIPLFRSSATADTFRITILKLPYFFLFITAIGWGIALFITAGLPIIISPIETLENNSLAVLGITGIGITSSIVGYYFLELFNRWYWIPRLFENRLESYRGLFQPSIGKRFFMYYLGASLAPIIVGLWIFGWAAFKHHIFSPQQLFYLASFTVFLIIIGVISTVIFSKTFQHPLVDATIAVQKITSGDFSVNLIVRSNDELGILSEGINNMASSLKADTEHIAALNREIELTQKEVIFTMGTIGESRSSETGNHVKRVAEYSKKLAIHYGLGEQQAELLKLASPMHDIGKVGIPDSILNKPGKLTPDEFEIMKQHAQLGYNLLCHSERELLKVASIVAFEHHEKFNGSGYPRGLTGSSIHIFGRITAVADVFDALGSDRVYKKAWSDEEIFTLLREQSNIHFDPDLVGIFFNNLPDFLSIRDSLKD